MPPTTCRRAAPLICWPTRPLAHVRLHLHRSPAFSPLSSPALRTNFWVCLAQKLCQAATKHMKVAAARQRVELWMRCRIALHLYPIHLAVVGSSHGSQPRELNCPSTLTRGVWFRPHYAGSKPNGTKDAIPLEQQQAVVRAYATKSQELGACCRPTETGAGPSDARVAAAASHFTGLFLACT